MRRRELMWRGAIALALLAGTLPAAGVPRHRRATREYSNVRWGFCLQYPATWTSNNGPDGDVIELTPVNTVPGTIHATITAAGYRDLRGHSGQRTAERPSPRGPELLLDDAVDALQDDMVRDLKVSSRQEKRWGFDALVSRLQYEEEGVRWRSEQIRIMRPDQSVLQLVVTAPEEQFPAAEKAFLGVAKSFRPACAPGKRFGTESAASERQQLPAGNH